MCNCRILSVTTLLLLHYALPYTVAQELLRVGKTPAEAQFLGIDPKGLPIFAVDGQQESSSADELLRWSHPPQLEASATAVLSDGSRLALADSWTGQRSWELSDTHVTLRTQLCGKLDIDRKQLAAILLRPLKKTQSPSELQDQLLLLNTVDVLWLEDGDRLEGRFLEAPHAKDGSRIRFSLPDVEEPLDVEEAGLAALQFARAEQHSNATSKWEVGLRDGSLINVSALARQDEGIRLLLTSGTSVSLTKPADVDYLRSFSPDCVFLSDLKAATYRHQPYLKTPWPFGSDRNVIGQVPRVSGHTYPKCLGMMTAARWSIALDDSLSRYDQFVASVALDDAALGQGSVVFRTYLLKNQQWQVEFTSPIMRGGDSPVQVRVALDNATELALVVDFADQGDELDYANWLDARLE